MSSDADAHLVAAIAAYRQDRAAAVHTVKVCDDRIAALEAILGAGRISGQPSQARRPASVTVHRSGRSVRDVAVELGNRLDIFTLADLNTALREAGNTSAYASVSSLMSRLVRQGVLTRVQGQKGTFRLAHTNIEAPAPAGASIPTDNRSAVRAADPLDHEGGDGHDEEEHLDPAASNRNLDPHRAASVAR